ncbi:MAG: EamA family transporter [Defluviimonas sp.]|uniref:aromatic amino acid exporter YddG n=1 Tax=Albidovulum sp. TaxID=1872424 RepID=UPI001D88B38F|nr:EamA family transporter [Paracoccaceae bacterium]MCC0063197.1 EamA family transporter [Defluviimonas sp.]
MTRKAATATGFLAVLLWALLAALTVATAPMPALLLNALTFAIGGAAGLVWIARNGSWTTLGRVPLWVYGFGIAGLFLYHLCYFTALRLAPPAEASLIAYLWPLLIVVFSGFLPGERLRPGHLAGTLLAFAGAALIVLAGADDAPPGPMRPTGQALAFLAALIWASYSVLSRRLGAMPTATVAIYCLGTAILSAAAHLAWETAAAPAGPWGWLACAALGLGPVGLAFYFWDTGVKHGDIQLLGVLAYAAPLLSTLVLIVAGIAPATPQLALSALMIAGGAALAARAGRMR